jgi:hypothetical protein
MAASQDIKDISKMAASQANTSELYIYIWSKNFSHSVNEKSEAK